MANEKIAADEAVQAVVESVPPEVQNTPEIQEMTPEALGVLFSSKKPATQDYISAQKEPEPKQPAYAVDEKYSHLQDRYRRKFNPELHETTASGEPVTTRNGNLKCRPGRPRLSAVQLKSPQEVVDEKQAVVAAQSEAQIKMCSTILVSCFLTIGVSTFGDEWRPRAEKEAGHNEVQMLQEATEEYFRATGTVNLPPWAGLMCAYGLYALPRFQQPKTLSKLEKLKMWISYQWQNFRNKRAGKPPIPTPTAQAPKSRQEAEASTAA
ncbi:hypothetical protein [Vampirovibrio chlorellavorus]|uniref:hypothetical protein n=1 Tax=Vampirovibrio chlorellavorus TaxID=758823 RepID=UPI0026EB0ACD|nr:hypothetical protein [Vampirovibrio chlorellavorus]